MNHLLISVFENEDRRAEVFKDRYHYGVHLYLRETRAWGYGRWILKRTELLEKHSVHMAEDLAENYVQKWGAFKDGN